MPVLIIFIFNMGELSSSLSFISHILFSLAPPHTTAQPYNAEFYFDTPNPVRILKGNNYSYNLQWTQKDPEATDRIIGYWINVRKVKYSCTNTCRELNILTCIHTHTSLYVLCLCSSIFWTTVRYIF